MLSLSPAKILVVLVVALVVLGPDKLPALARQLGGLWGDLRRLRERLEGEVRGVFPDLPPAHEITQAVRSPLSFLDRLADEHERSRNNGESAPSTTTTGSAEGDGSADADGGANGNGRANGNGNGAVSRGEQGEWDASAPDVAEPTSAVPDDPSMN